MANKKVFFLPNLSDKGFASTTPIIFAACPNTKYIDLDGSLDLAEDLVNGGFEIVNGEMKIYQTAGFGFNLL